MAGQGRAEGGAADEWVDLHMPCVACPVVVRDLYFASVALLGAVGGLRGAAVVTRDVERRVETTADNLAVAIQRLQIFVEGHTVNQEHAFAPELEEARTAPPLRPMRRSEMLRGLLLDVEWGLRMATESATPQALDVPGLLTRVRDRLLKTGVY